jgi:hypothetical protein
MSAPHKNTHRWFGGTIEIEHIAASDPLFFLMHSNVDRLFALWQLQPGHTERLDGNTIYGSLGDSPSLSNTMKPWDGSTGAIPWVPGNTEPTGGVDAKTPKDPSVVTPPSYDTNPPPPEDPCPALLQEIAVDEAEVKQAREDWEEASPQEKAAMKGILDRAEKKLADAQDRAREASCI